MRGECQGGGAWWKVNIGENRGDSGREENVKEKRTGDEGKKE